jgi:hypothetical protein
MGTMDQLVNEAMRKAAVAWIGVGNRPPYAVWCLWMDGALYVVSGSGEQPAPGLASAGSATVQARGDHGGLIVEWTAAVQRVRPGSELWATVAPQLAAKRLNSGPAPALLERWASHAAVSRLVPVEALSPQTAG